MKKLVFALSIVFWLPCFSQRTERIFTGLTTADGLSSNTIVCLMEDSQGFIWIGTQDGLNRYDGNAIKQFIHNPNDAFSLNNNWVNGMFEDAEGFIWVLTNMGISRYDPRKDIFQNNQPISQSKCARRLTELERLLRDSIPIYQIRTADHQTKIIRNYPFAPKGFLPRKDGSILILTKTGIQTYKPNQQELTPFPLPPGFEATLDEFKSKINQIDIHDSSILQFIKESPHGDIWLKNKKGYFCISRDGASFRYFPMPTSTHGRHLWNSMAIDPNGHIWMASDGLAHYDPTKTILNRFEHDPLSSFSLSSGFVTSVLRDKTGKIWVGANTGGVSILNPDIPPMTVLRHNPYVPNSFSSNEPTTILEDGDQGLWIGSYDGLNYLDNRSGKITHFLEGRLITSIERTPAGDIIAEVYSDPFGHFVLDKKRNQFIRYPGDSSLTLPSLLFRTYPFTDSKGNKYFYSYAPGMVEPASGLYFYKASENRLRFIQQDNKNPRTLTGWGIYGILESSNHRIWIAPNGGGLNLFDPKTEEIRRFQPLPDHQDSLSIGTITVLYEDSRGNIWLGSGFHQGINVIPAEALAKDSIYFIRYNRANSALFSDAVNGFAEDKLGRVWISTASGLSYAVLPSFELHSLKFINAKIHHNYWGFTKGASGKFYLGTSEGLFVFRPEDIQKNDIPPPVYITEFRLNNRLQPVKGTFGDTIPGGSPLEQSIMFTKRLELTHFQNDISFTFTALNYSFPELNRYRYRLLGYNTTWIETGNDRPFATFTNLAPGRYTFQVMGSNNYGVWNPKPAKLEIFIRPPWWWNSWSITLYVILLGWVLYSVYRFQLSRRLAEAEASRLRELDTLKTRLVANISHEFRTPLSNIIGTTNLWERDPEKWSKEGSRRIRRNSKDLLRLVEQMLGLSKLEAGTMRLNLRQGDVIAYLKYLIESVHSLAEARSIELRLVSEPSQFYMDYDPEKWQAIVINLLSNALKFTPEEGKVFLEVLPEVNNQFRFQVRDTGPGIATEHLPNIFDPFYQADPSTEGGGVGIGLAYTRELVRLLGGTIQVESTPGQGARFIVHLPVSRNAELADQQPVREKEFPEASSLVLTAPVTADDGAPILLLVEDNADVRSYLQHILSPIYRILLASDGKEGLETAIEKVPDIIISDVMMPGMDGFTLCETLKTDWRTSHIPVVLLTARADVESRIAGLKRGADAYLPKPIGESELYAQLASLLENRRKWMTTYADPEFLSGRQSLPASTEETELEDAFVLQARAIILAHLDDFQFDVPRFCRLMTVSRPQLHRKLKVLTGLSATQFIRALRIEEAKKLLTSGKDPIYSIAEQCGFQTVSNFNRVFFDGEKMTPTEYRAKFSSGK